MKASAANPPAPSAATAVRVQQALAPFELRLTKHRRAVVGSLEAAGRPLTADEVVQQSGVPTSTAYRILAEMAQAGVVARVGSVGGGERHELAEQCSDHHHHHLLCTECGMVTDFDPSDQLERLISKEVSALLDAAGFEVTHHIFDVRGRCRDCRR